ncbi:MAG TPA: ceramidase domain-containing protein, partial [Marinagarivorans sp.]|nr:ceramidase domain-containing protein [Marinagarivorans sp.]
MDKRMFYLWGLVIISLASVLGVFIWLPPIAQTVAYHQFADERSFLSISHFWNVVSNLMFAVSGAVGVWVVRGGDTAFAPELRVAYRVFFVGVMLVAVGSAYYHWAPDNATLVWDRLPMTVAFMALFAIVIGEHISPSAGAKLLVPLISSGVAAVAYWAF